MNGKRPYMDYPQYRAARRLVHECCNYDNGNCILLDNGEPCVCVQSISYSLLCRWFIAAVLPLNGKLEAALLHRADRNGCTECGGYFLPKSNRGKYCPDCVTEVRRGNTVLVVSGYFMQGTTAADKMMKVLEAESAAGHKPSLPHNPDMKKRSCRGA